VGGGNPDALCYGAGSLEPLASRKGVDREIRSEGSETAKVGTDEQEPDKEAM